MNKNRTEKHWTHCDKCEQPNPNWEWSNYCPACREEWQKQHDEIERFWAQRCAEANR